LVARGPIGCGQPALCLGRVALAAGGQQADSPDLGLQGGSAAYPHDGRIVIFVEQLIERLG
jgi:hypothetical protein